MEDETKKELKTLDEVLNSFQLHLKAKKGQYNSFGRYKYRTAEDILAAFKEEAKKGIYPKNCILLTNIELKEILNRLFVCVIATLRVGKDEVKSEGFAEHAVNKKGMDEAQLTGATITYARKYALQNLFGIDESKDDLDDDDNQKDNNITKSIVSQNLADSALDDQKQVFNEYYEKEFNRLINLIKNIKNEKELKELAEREKKALDNLKKNRPDLVKRLSEVWKSKANSFEETTAENAQVEEKPMTQQDKEGFYVLAKNFLSDPDNSIDDKKLFLEEKANKIKFLDDSQSSELYKLIGK